MTLEGHLPAAIQWGVVLGASLVAAATDLKSRRIPNLLTLPLLLAGLGASLLHGGPGALASAAAACVLLALPYVLLFVFANGGAGDAKMMGAVGAWLGLEQGLVALLCVSLTGVVLATGYAAFGGRLREVYRQMSTLGLAALQPVFGVGSFRDVPGAMPTTTGAQTMPYGLAILAGLLVCWGMLS